MSGWVLAACVTLNCFSLLQCTHPSVHCYFLFVVVDKLITKIESYFGNISIRSLSRFSNSSFFYCTYRSCSAAICAIYASYSAFFRYLSSSLYLRSISRFSSNSFYSAINYCSFSNIFYCSILYYSTSSAYFLLFSASITSRFFSYSFFFSSFSSSSFISLSFYFSTNNSVCAFNFSIFISLSINDASSFS